MGYYIFSYAIKYEQIKAVFGSKDKTLTQKIQENDMYQHYNDNEYDEGEISLDEAINDIIFANPYKPKMGYQYGYALICICATLGIQPPHTQEMKFGYETDLVNHHLYEDFDLNTEIDELMFEFNPFDFLNITDWPMIGVIDQFSLQQNKKQLKDIQITDKIIEELEESDDEDDEDKLCAYEHIAGFIKNVNFCLENQLDLISFCH